MMFKIEYKFLLLLFVILLLGLGCSGTRPSSNSSEQNSPAATTEEQNQQADSEAILINLDGVAQFQLFSESCTLCLGESECATCVEDATSKIVSCQLSHADGDDSFLFFYSCDSLDGTFLAGLIVRDREVHHITIDYDSETDVYNFKQEEIGNEPEEEEEEPELEPDLDLEPPLAPEPIVELDSGLCFLIADSGGQNGGDDLLTQVNLADTNPNTNEVNIGNGTSTSKMESIALSPISNILYGVNEGKLGIINQVTGTFSPVSGRIGKGGGALGLIEFKDIDGLAFHPITEELFASVRRSNSDLLIQINISTGLFVADAFGSGVDYVVIDPIAGCDDVDDIAIDPTDLTLYATTSDCSNDHFVIVNPTTGDTTDVGPLTEAGHRDTKDMEGLTFDAQGQLLGTHGDGHKTIYRIDKLTGALSNPIEVDNAEDYEGIECTTESICEIDSDNDGTSNCEDQCPLDSQKTEPSTCGCGVEDNDLDGDGIMDCQDICLNDPENECQKEGVCFLMADNGGGNGGDDLLTLLDLNDPNPNTNEINIGTGTGTYHIEAIAFDPLTGTLYGADQRHFGTLNQSSGIFTPSSEKYGYGYGALGKKKIQDVDGLTFDTRNNEMLGSVRRSDADLLIKIDPSTGARIPNAFGPGLDYVVIDPVAGCDDVDDIAIDPTDFTLYATVSDCNNDHLVIVDPTTGNTTDVGPLTEAGNSNTKNMEGLAFDSQGQLYGTHGDSHKLVYQIDKSNGSLSHPIEIDNGRDYEGIECIIKSLPEKSFCGDGIVDEEEECDSSPHCSSSCILQAYCGDGEVNDGEQCDGTPHCSDSCTVEPFCGDGIVNNDEACDGGENCSSSCTVLPYCGDDIINNDEACDGGENCSSSCTIEPFCGDGIVNNDEACDGTEHCSGNCKILPYCGDKIVNNQEECDGGAHCTQSCTFEKFCGDGITNNDETCDDGNHDNKDSCSNQCEITFCGDGKNNRDEQCDDGNTKVGDGCNSQCRVEFCGDGIRQSSLGEQCDDGNSSDTDTCSNSCKATYCGDGKINGGEECDDGNALNNDGCNVVCQEEFCGDNITQANLGESCDDGNNKGGDGCSPSCKKENQDEFPGGKGGGDEFPF